MRRSWFESMRGSHVFQNCAGVAQQARAALSYGEGRLFKSTHRHHPPSLKLRRARPPKGGGRRSAKREDGLRSQQPCGSSVARTPDCGSGGRRFDSVPRDQPSPAEAELRLASQPITEREGGLHCQITQGRSLAWSKAPVSKSGIVGSNPTALAIPLWAIDLSMT
jgi:hypothetical protein